MSVVKPYVVIDVDRLGVSKNSKPFGNVLVEPNTKHKKSLRSTFMYVFYATFGDLVLWKVGESHDAKTYHSKDRFCPSVDYNSVLQVLHFGKALESLVMCYLRSEGVVRFKRSEWFAGAEKALLALTAAIHHNPDYKRESPIQMVNVSAFDEAFTCGMNASPDKYLSLFRVRCQGKLYRLTAANVMGFLREIATPEYEERPPAAPAPPNDDADE